MFKGSLAKYKIGLGLIGVFVLVLLILVISQASGTKKDTDTYNQANNIANTLNNYLDTNDTVPSSLEEAGVNNVPSTITYQKLSDSKYKFCVDYQTTSSNFSASSVESNVINSGASGSLTSGSSTDGSLTNSTETILIINTSHHKGMNCQTVETSPSTTINPPPTTIYNNGGSGSDTSGSDTGSTTGSSTTQTTTLSQ
jgi:hypothetical protein